MYIKQDKTTASEHIPDSYELTEEQEQIVRENNPWFDLTIEDGVVTAVTPTERPEPEPPTPPEPSEMELTQQDITDLQLANIEMGQEITDLQIALMEVSV